MYFTLINDLKYESSFVVNEPDNLPMKFDLMSGVEMNVPISLPLVYTTNAKKGDALRAFLKGSNTLVSSEFLDLLKKAGVTNLQTFPAVIKSTEDGYVWDNYFGLNILGVIECADLGKSTYDEIMPGHYSFDELVIDTVKIPDGSLMFRLKEHVPTIIIHRSVGRLIKDYDPEKKSLSGWSVGKIIQ